MSSRSWHEKFLDGGAGVTEKKTQSKNFSNDDFIIPAAAFLVIVLFLWFWQPSFVKTEGEVSVYKIILVAAAVSLVVFFASEYFT